MAKTHPLDGKLVTVVGGSGFLGDHVAQALLSRGARVRIASRHPSKAWRLKPLAQLGQLQFAQCDATKPASAAAAVAGSDAVVNLVGTFQGDLVTTIVDSAENIARAAAENGCAAMVHVSAIGADAEFDRHLCLRKGRERGRSAAGVSQGDDPAPVDPVRRGRRLHQHVCRTDLDGPATAGLRAPRYDPAAVGRGCGKGGGRRSRRSRQARRQDLRDRGTRTDYHARPQRADRAGTKPQAYLHRHARQRVRFLRDAARHADEFRPVDAAQAGQPALRAAFRGSKNSASRRARSDCSSTAG